MTFNQRNVADAKQAALRHRAVCRLIDLHELLRTTLGPHGHHHAPARSKLLQQRLWYTRCCRTDMDGIEWGPR
eukprot:CAMPEP_0181189436 /NCGR_PEP_ID=MMETSP1096-20121128/11659_1 /TAXON_ID=156174 ORGANISM="Chrysochromulina ericina, Strain CCMP281" /NCGR_SAMPLE_ID=MMETSP1096 /ASSEMBLY_ACC=CAM_ASM_000453 /LENGTH=72 /DNA_ID=CAMNT_0023278585 /DNA_START=422 /DNA_END=640 /DNA_ORIENTATION=+